MFFKIAVLKYFAIILLRKHLCWSDFLIKLQAYRPVFLLKERLQHRCFLEKFLRTAFFVEHLTVHYTFSKFYVMIYFLDVLGTKLTFFISFVSLLWFPLVHAYSVIAFTTKFCKCKFRTHYNVGSCTILIESLKFMNNSRITGISLSNLYCENCEYQIFEYYALLLFLFRSGLARHGLK